MKIKLMEMRWSDMLSYGQDNFIDFSARSITQLVGPNGAGKTSIAVILEEVLFNKNSKNKKKASLLNRYTRGNKYLASITFMGGDDLYEVSVVRTSTQKVTFTKNGEDISSHTATDTYKNIQKVLGIDHKTFTQIVYKSGGSALEFLTGADSARKKFLIEFLNLSKYIEAGTIFKAKSSEISKYIAELNGKISTINQFINTHSKQEPKILDIKEVPELDSDKLEERQSLEKELNSIDSINAKRRQNKSYKQMLNNLTLLDIPPKVPDKDIETKVGEIASLESTLNLNKTQISKWKKLGDVCPTCSSPVSLDKKEEIVTSLTSINDSIAEKLTEEQNSLADLKRRKSSHIRGIENNNEWERIKSCIDDSIPEELLEAEDIQKKLNILSTYIDKTKTSINKILEENKKATENNARVEYILKNLLEYKEQLDAHKTKLIALESELNINNILVKTFSNTGLVAYKIEGLVADLHNTSNEYLHLLSNGRFQISFELSGSDKLECIISDHGKQVDIHDLSSGELSSISVAVLLSIRRLMQNISSTSINLLFLDENIVHIDRQTKERLVEVLLEDTSLNTFLVAHEFSHPLVHKMDIVKKDKISHIMENTND